MLESDLGSLPDFQNVHAVHVHSRNTEGGAAAVEFCFSRAATDGGSHGVLVVFDHKDDRQIPERRHVHRFIYLALVGRTVAEVGQAETAIVVVLVSQRETTAQ